MRTFLILLFILVSNTVYAKNAGGKKICEGFCKGEEYGMTMGGQVVPKDVVINGKKKKIKFQGLDTNVWVLNSWCRPFTKYVIFEPYPKKNKILDLVSNSYFINICGPCPTDMKRTSSGYCALIAYQYIKIYDRAISFGLFPKNLFTNYDDFKIKKRGLMVEFFTISVTNKKNLNFWKYFSKSENKYLYMYSTEEYKTSFKRQAIKVSSHYSLTDDNFIKFLNDFQQRIVNAWSSDLADPTFFEKLYSSLPTKKELDILFYNFNEVKQFHIQTRN